VAFTEAIITGTEIGKKRIDKRTSLALVVAEIAENIVPIAVKPKVPRKVISPSGTRKGRMVVLYFSLGSVGKKDAQNCLIFNSVSIISAT